MSHDSPWQGAIILQGANSLEEVETVLSTIQNYVPRLIKQYEELWDMSQSLLAAVEQWKAQGEGGQLLVADTKDVASLMRDDPPPF